MFGSPCSKHPVSRWGILWENCRGHPYLISADRSTSHGNLRSSELHQNLERLGSHPAQIQHGDSRSGRFRLVKSPGSGISQPALCLVTVILCLSPRVPTTEDGWRWAPSVHRKSLFVQETIVFLLNCLYREVYIFLHTYNYCVKLLQLLVIYTQITRAHGYGC